MKGGRVSFIASAHGAVLVETLLVVPVLFILTVGILEFGNVLWQRHQLQVGVRDAARYMARCTADATGSWTGGSCSTEIARNIAFYGQPVGPEVTPASTEDCPDYARVPNWCVPDQLSIALGSTGDCPNCVSVTGTLGYAGSPLIGFLNIPDNAIPISYEHMQRHIGW